MLKDIKYRWAIILCVLISAAYLIWPTYKLYSLDETEVDKVGFEAINDLKKDAINLGLDLQGGSYLLLEVDCQPVLKRKLQDKVIFIRKGLKSQKIKLN